MVITSTLLVHSHEARVLFDLGSMNLYVSPMFAKCFSKPMAWPEEPFLVATPVGEALTTEYS